MASCILILKRVLASSSSRLKCAFTRGFCQPSSRCVLEQLESHLEDLNKSLSPSVVTLESFFYVPDNREIHQSYRRGTGVFLDPTLIVTSAHVVGRVSTFYEPKPAEKSDRFDQGYILHKSYIGSTAAVTVNNEVLKTKPLAVNFSNDLAVLKVVKPEESLFLHCAVANSLPDKEDILMGITHRLDVGFAIMWGNVRAIQGKTVRAKVPWPLDDEMGWMEYDWFIFGGIPPPRSTFFNRREKVSGAVTGVTGSPWFNLHGEVVGIASWEARDKPARFPVGFAVPPMCIRAVLDYAKNKDPEDPIVMDHWIDAHVIPGMDEKTAS